MACEATVLDVLAGAGIRTPQRRLTWRERARENRIAEREIAIMAESIAPRLDAVGRASRRTG